MESNYSKLLNEHLKVNEDEEKSVDRITKHLVGIEKALSDLFKQPIKLKLNRIGGAYESEKLEATFDGCGWWSEFIKTFSIIIDSLAVYPKDSNSLFGAGKVYYEHVDGGAKGSPLWIASKDKMDWKVYGSREDGLRLLS